ncbi:MAG: FHA domain-containing protein [Planctomycetaceae bacterium]
MKRNEVAAKGFSGMSESNVLLIPPGTVAGACIKLHQGKTVVGRSAGCDILLADISVSRRHAELFIESTTISVRDLQSQNGTYVDHQRIQSSDIRPGQELQFGNVAFVVSTNVLIAEGCNSELETAKMKGSLASLPTSAGRALLSAAQRRVFDLLLDGLAEKQVARRLELSRHTVHNHVREIYRTLDVHSRSELMARFMPGPNIRKLSAQ